MFLWRGAVSTTPNSQAGGPPLVGCPRLPIQYIRSYSPYWRPFLHPQPEDAQCRGDRNPLTTRASRYICPYIGTNVCGCICTHTQVRWYTNVHAKIHACNNDETVRKPNLLLPDRPDCLLAMLHVGKSVLEVCHFCSCSPFLSLSLSFSPH